MYNSIVQERGKVAFPEFLGERIYMQAFLQSEGLPAEFSRWQNTVDDMLNGIKTDKPIYLMVDQKVVEKGQPQRRPGLHVDGYWMAGATAHRGGGHRSSINAHGGDRHNGTPPPYTHGGNRHQANHSSGKSGWNSIDFSTPEAIMLASNVSACAAYVGQYDETLIGHGGDASKVHDKLDRIVLNSNQVYAGNVGFLHESLAVDEDCFRTLVRLNVPGWTPTLH
jgi:hypothetical protein